MGQPRLDFSAFPSQRLEVFHGLFDRLTIWRRYAESPRRLLRESNERPLDRFLANVEGNPGCFPCYFFVTATSRMNRRPGEPNFSSRIAPARLRLTFSPVVLSQVTSARAAAFLMTETAPNT